MRVWRHKLLSETEIADLSAIGVVVKISGEATCQEMFAEHVARLDS